MNPIIGFAGATLIIGLCLLAKCPRWFTAIMFAVLLVALAQTGIAALGRPIPLSVAAYWLPAEITVAGYQLREGVAIDILVAGNPPLLVSLPWSEPKAAQLQEAAEQAKAKHASLKATTGRLVDIGHISNEAPLFYPEPPAALPPKQGE